MTVKTCTKCGETKPLDEFSPQKSRKDGRKSHCKECCAAHMRNRRLTDPVYAQRDRDLCAARRRGETLEPLPKKSADERFDEKWIEDENGCWVWQAHTNEEGYGQFGTDGETFYAHRWNYARAHGPISDDNELHHTCGVRACVRPEHLVEMTEEAHRKLHKERGQS